jgi:hypothetical protein
VIFLDSGQFDAAHYAEVVLGGLSVAATVFVPLWLFHRQDRKDRDAKSQSVQDALLRAAREAEEKNEERHAENKEVLNKLTIRMKYTPPHLHTEKKGPLTVENIWYGPEDDK